MYYIYCHLVSLRQTFLLKWFLVARCPFLDVQWRVPLSWASWLLAQLLGRHNRALLLYAYPRIILRLSRCCEPFCSGLLARRSGEKAYCNSHTHTAYAVCAFAYALLDFHSSWNSIRRSDIGRVSRPCESFHALESLICFEILYRTVAAHLHNKINIRYIVLVSGLSYRLLLKSISLTILIIYIRTFENSTKTI